MRILVIDDDRLYTEPLIWRLEREGYDVVYCQTADEVLDDEGSGALEPKPDCILLDMMMGRGDRYTKKETDSGGHTGMVILRDIERRIGKVPVIVLTVRNEEDFHLELRKRFDTIRRILVKPVTPTQVVSTLASVFGTGMKGGQ